MNRLEPTESEWRRVSPKYVWVDLVGILIFGIIVVGGTSIPGIVSGLAVLFVIPAVIAVIFVITLAFTPRRVRAIGYQLRDDDLLFRRGLMFQRFVSVPYGRRNGCRHSGARTRGRREPARRVGRAGREPPGGSVTESELQVTPTPSGRLADGEWHRLHPTTPLLRGGFAFIAILGIVVVNLRDVALEVIIGGSGGPPDPLVWLFEHDFALPILAAIAVGLALFIGGFYLSWRMHTFRITDELVEVRSGILFRTNRRGRLDRIQGINIARPFLSRLVGAAKLEINVAGQDANVQLAYLGSRAADELRREILALASGSRVDPSAAGVEARSASGLIEQRVGEFFAPELDPNAAPPQSVVQMHPGRLVGSLVFSGTTVVLVLVGIAAAIFLSLTGNYFVLIGFVPGLIGFVGFYVNRITRSLRYSIA
ncbi:MAG: PH domain-containing protein, partial [Rhodoglobus sp.]